MASESSPAVSGRSSLDSSSLDTWSLFLRQRRILDQLKRLRNDFKHCYCPPECQGQPQDHILVDPRDVPGLPAQPLHGPHVPVDSDLPDTWGRPESLRGPGDRVLAESRGTSDIRLHQTGARATLRMSMQVRMDATLAGRIGYFGEMFLTQHGQEEEFIGYIQSWYMDRSGRDPQDGQRDWEALYLDDFGQQFTDWMDRRNDFAGERSFFLQLFGQHQGSWEDAPRDQNGNLLPQQEFRNYHFGSAWAGANEDTDIIYIPFIWLEQQYTGQRIIDQGFELFWRLMTGGSLPEPYNVTRPLSAFLEAGLLKRGENWRGSDGRVMNDFEHMWTIASAYERNGFMILGRPDEPRPTYFYMGRRVDPADFTAAPGDMAIVPPNPPATNMFTPSPVRRRRVEALRRRARPPKIGRPGGGPRNVDDGDNDDDDDDDDDDDNSSPLPGGRPAPGTGMGRGKGPRRRRPARTPIGNRRGRPNTPSAPRGGRPTTGGLSLGSAQRRLF